MNDQGTLRKMASDWQNPVQYYLALENARLDLNALRGQYIELAFTGHIFCVQCGRRTNKSFQQGLCYPCFRRLAECNYCTIHPERCLCEQQHCPQDDWAHSQCNQPHILYLANTSDLKVGITRADQIPTRWIDQGATQALPIMRLQNRYQSGLVEQTLKAYIADKTNWRQMLKTDNARKNMQVLRDDLLEKAEHAIKQAQQQFQQGEVTFLESEPYEIEFPIEQYPRTIKTFNFDKNRKVHGYLWGMKGQYLILDQGVINIRKFGGYEINVQC